MAAVIGVQNALKTLNDRDPTGVREITIKMPVTKA